MTITSPSRGLSAEGQASLNQAEATKLVPTYVILRKDHQSGTDEENDYQSNADEENDHQSGADDLLVHTTRVRSAITGQLCQKVLALICWRKGCNKDVLEDSVKVLERWLCNWGISIYIDSL
jgi:hypothetical protein